jgi:hypothetical protein
MHLYRKQRNQLNTLVIDTIRNTKLQPEQVKDKLKKMVEKHNET